MPIKPTERSFKPQQGDSTKSDESQESGKKAWCWQPTWRQVFQEMGGLPAFILVMIGAVYTLTALTVLEYAPTGEGWRSHSLFYGVVLPIAFLVAALFWARPVWRELRRK